MNARSPRPWSRASLAALALSLACVAIVGESGCASSKKPARGKPLDPVTARGRPLDPLTAREREAAQQAALADPRVRELLADQPHRVISVDFAADKGASSEVVRGAEVFLYRPDRDVGVRALVHLQPVAVVAVAPVPGPQVPLTNDDYQLARELALRSPEVQSRFGKGLQRADIEMLRELPSDPDDPCVRHRCVFLLFRLPEGYASGPRVVVDLNAREVRVKGEER